MKSVNGFFLGKNDIPLCGMGTFRPLAIGDGNTPSLPQLF
jgi:hypothetical protein